MPHVLIVVGRVLVLAVLGYFALVFALQRRMAFPGTLRSSTRPTASAPPDVTQVWLEASFGPVEAWLFNAQGDVDGPTIIFAHGNGELIEDRYGDMEHLAAAGANVLLVEYPGYGHSGGTPSRSTLRETFTLAFDWLVARDGIDADRIIAHGWSLGGGVAADLALDRPIRALVLQSTFSSAKAIARANLVPGFLVRDRFDNLRGVSDFSGPILLMHGVRDDVIPYAHAEMLAAAREGLDITELDCAHNDCASEWPEIVALVTEFLRSNELLDG